MSTASELADLRVEVAELRALVEGAPHVQAMRTRQAKERAAAEARARCEALESAEAGERVKLFASLSDAEQRDLVERISPQRWASILSETPFERRRPYLAAIARSPIGSKLGRLLAFEVAPAEALPPVVVVRTAGSTQEDVGGRIIGAKPSPMLVSKWEEFLAHETYGVGTRARVAAGAIVVEPASDAVARAFLRGEVSIPAPSIG